MHTLSCMLLLCFISEGVHGKNGFDEPLDFSPVIEGPASLASNPLSSVILKADKNRYPQLFDTIVSSSIDSIQTRSAPKGALSVKAFGFNPNVPGLFNPNQGFAPPVKSAKLTNQPRTFPHFARLQHQPHLAPLNYDIRTVHDANYKVYKDEDQAKREEISSPLKNNPAYFKRPTTNIEITHPLKYRKEEAIENPEAIDENYKPNAYIAGSSRIRRYTDGRRSENVKQASSEEEEEEDDPYDFKSYRSRPKEFDSPLYSAAYKEEKDPNKDYEYPYDYDSGYDHKEYERIKELSDKQAEEIRQNPGNCQEVIKDGMKCQTCKDPKTGGNYESCSYVTEPKNNQYAYSKERKFDSRDEPEEPEDEKKESPKKSEKYEESKEDEKSAASSDLPYSPYKKEERDDSSEPKYQGYYVHSAKPKVSAALRASEDEDSEEKKDELSKPYNYKQAIPGFYTDNEPKKDVEHVLAEFKKKDRSSCKKVQKNGMTCFQCIDSSGLKNEECMFVSESAPQRSHVAYQELKEFTSKPPTLEGVAEGAESITVTTNTPLSPHSAAYVVATNGYGKKIKKRKVKVAQVDRAATSPVAVTVLPSADVDVKATQKRSKRSDESELEERARITDETNVAPPEEFSGAQSKGAFWAETMPRYSAALGVTLPEFMLSRSEHEAAFDEVVAGA